MNPVVPSRVIAGAAGMIAFAISVIAGLVVGNPAGDILWRSLVSMICCYTLGLLIGIICEHVVQEHLRRYRADRPSPDSTKEMTQFDTSGG